MQTCRLKFRCFIKTHTTVVPWSAPYICLKPAKPPSIPPTWTSTPASPALQLRSWNHKWRSLTVHIYCIYWHSTVHECCNFYFYFLFNLTCLHFVFLTFYCVSPIYKIGYTSTDSDWSIMVYGFFFSFRMPFLFLPAKVSRASPPGWETLHSVLVGLYETLMSPCIVCIRENDHSSKETVRQRFNCFYQMATSSQQFATEGIKPVYYHTFKYVGNKTHILYLNFSKQPRVRTIRSY